MSGVWDLPDGFVSFMEPFRSEEYGSEPSMRLPNPRTGLLILLADVIMLNRMCDPPSELWLDGPERTSTKRIHPIRYARKTYLRLSAEEKAEVHAKVIAARKAGGSALVLSRRFGIPPHEQYVLLDAVG